MSLSSISVIILLSVVLIAVIISNRQLLWEIKWRLPFYLIHALCAWSLFGVIILTFAYINHVSSAEAEDLLYFSSFVSDDCTDTETHQKCGKNRHRENIKSGIAREIEAGYSSAVENIGDLKVTIDKNAGEAPKISKDFFLASTPKDLPGTKKESCSFLNLICYATEFVKGRIRQFYTTKRDKVADSIFSGINGYANDATRETSELQEYSVSKLDIARQEFLLETQARVDTGFYLWELYLIVSSVWLLLIALKTYLMVLGRVIFSERKTSIQFVEGKDRNQGDIHTYPNTPHLDFDFDGASAVYVRGDRNVAGVKPILRITQPFRLVFARLWSMYFTRRVDLTGSETTPTISQHGAREYVTWNLGNEDCVLFNPSSLVGFSDQVRLRPRVSLRFSTLIYGKVVFPSARGSGILIFETRGPASIGSEDMASKSVDVSRHIAYGENTRFRLVVSLNPWDTLVSGYNVEKHDSDAGIVDTYADGTTKAKIGRYLRYFLIPV